jgi:hypothetical protein
MWLLHVLLLFTVHVLLPLCVQLPIAAVAACANAFAYAVTIMCAGVLQRHCYSFCCLWCYCCCMCCCCCICCCLCRYCSIWLGLLLHMLLLLWYVLLLLHMSLLMPCCICCCILSVWLLHLLVWLLHVLCYSHYISLVQLPVAVAACAVAFVYAIEIVCAAVLCSCC